MYDDPTHTDAPPDYDKIMETLERKGFKIIFTRREYKPIILRLGGFLGEHISHLRKKVIKAATWAYYGFESVIWAKKPFE
jgi:hypothetical protein